MNYCFRKITNIFSLVVCGFIIDSILTTKICYGMDVIDNTKLSTWTINEESHELTVQNIQPNFIKEIRVKNYSENSSAVMIFVTSNGKELGKKLIINHNIEKIFCSKEMIYYPLKVIDQFRHFIEDVAESDTLPPTIKNLIIGYGERFIQSHLQIPMTEIKKTNKISSPKSMEQKDRKHYFSSSERIDNALLHASHYDVVRRMVYPYGAYDSYDGYEQPSRSEVEFREIISIIEDCIDYDPQGLSGLLTYIDIKRSHLLSFCVKDIIKRHGSFWSSYKANELELLKKYEISPNMS